MERDDDVTALARHLFDCIRNVHMSLAAGDAVAGRQAIIEARKAHADLDHVADTRDRTVVGLILLAVLHERIGGLDELVEHLPAGRTKRQ